MIRADVDSKAVPVRRPHGRLLVSSLVLLAVFLAAGALEYRLAHSAFERELIEEAGSLRTAYRVAVAVTEREMFHVATFLAEDPGIRELMVQARVAREAEGGDGPRADVLREALYARVRDGWDAVRERHDGRQLHFHLPPATSFLRVHAPARHGDDLSAVRPMVQAVNTDGLPRSGYEVGRIYAGLRAVVPVKAPEDDERVGSIEVGVGFTELLEQLDRSTRASFAVLLRQAVVERNTWEDYRQVQNLKRLTQCGCYVEAVSRPDAEGWLESVPDTRDLPTEGYTLLSTGGRWYNVVRMPLQDFSDVRNPKGETVGSVLAWSDRTEQVTAFRQAQLSFLVALGGVYLLIVAGAWRVLRREVGSIQGELRASRAQLQHLMAVSPAVLYQVRLKEGTASSFLSANLFEVFGYRPENVVGDASWWQAGIHPDDREAVARTLDWQRWPGGRISRRYRFQHADGHYLWVADQVSVVFDERGAAQELVGMLAVIDREMGDRDRLERIAANVPGMVYQYQLHDDGRSSFPYTSEGIRTIYEVEPEEARRNAASVLDRVHPEDRERVLGRILDSAASLAVWRDQYRVVLPRRGERWVEGVATPQKLQDGSVLWHGYLFDISERKQAERQRDMLAAVVENAADIIVVKDLDLRVIATNTAFARAAGYTRIEDMLGKTDAEIFGLSEQDEPVRGYMRDERRAQALPRGECLLIEEPVKHADGSLHVVLTRKFPVYDREGRLIATANISSDITERKTIEDALRASESRYRLIAENMQDLICLHEPDGRYTYVSPSVRGLLGFAPEDLIGHDPYMLFHPEDAQRIRAASHVPALDGQANAPIEYRILTRDGHWRWFETRTIPLRGADDQITALQTVSRDVTDKVEAEQALARSERLYRSIFENVDEAIFLVRVEANGQFRYVAHNPHHARATGLTTQALVGHTPEELLPADLAEQVQVHYRQCLDVAQPIQYTEVLSLPGGRRTWLTGLYPVHDETGRIELIVGLSLDITERNRLEQDLRASEERLRLTLEAVQDGVWDWDLASSRVTWDARCYEMLGYAPQSFMLDKSRVMELIHPDDCMPMFAEVERSMADKARFRVEFRLRRADGEWLWVEGRGMVIEFEEGRPRRVIGTHTDITERVRARREIERLSRHNERLLMAAAEGIYGVDAQGRATFANPAVTRLLGYAREEVLGQPAHRLFHPTRPDGAPYPAERCPMALTLQDGQDRHSIDDWFRHKDGHFVPVSLSVAAVQEEDGQPGAVVVFQDMTERYRAEEALRAARTRLATIIEQFHGGVLVEDETRHIVLLNQSFLDLFGMPVTPEVLLGQDCTDSATQAAPLFIDPEAFVMRIDELIACRAPAIGEELALVDGRTFERDYLPILAGHRFIGHLWLYRDITERKQRELELRRLATTDPLTGLANRRYFLERADQELHRIQRYGQEAVLVMIDLDHFKRINDHYGHVVGDEALRRFALCTRQMLRRSDLAGRLGGEEFALLLPGTGLAGALEISERLRCAVADIVVPVGTEGVSFTISLGVTAMHQDDEKIEAALARADDALYKAKQEGRNRVCASAVNGG